MAQKSIPDLIEEADGEPRYMRELLEQIFHRLPPIPPPPPPTAVSAPYWDPTMLAKLQVDPDQLTSTNRWHLGKWLKDMAEEFIEGTIEAGEYLFTLGSAQPPSGPRKKRGEG